MDDGKSPIELARDDNAEFARRMYLLENGPTTTLFEQLIAAGVELPEPDAIGDADMRSRLWRVIAELARRRVFLDLTDHMTDRQLYSALWADHLHLEVPAVDETGFNTHLEILSCADEEQARLYLRHYADDRFRESWIKDDPAYDMPPHEDPAYDRDRLLPRPDHEEGPEALAWLRAHPSLSAFASNRFASTQKAAAFVEQLYSAGAMTIVIDNINLLPGDDWLPYADTLMVTLPEPGGTRRAVMDVIEEAGRPDENSGEPLEAAGRDVVRLWWD